MSEPVEWLADGTPYSPRFADRYRSESGGMAQARQVFLQGCGLPDAWAGQAQWRILETGFGLGLNFLVAWQAWKADPARPALLHFVSTEAYPASAADVLRAAATHPELLPLATELHAQFRGLLPGFHRLVFEGGHVLLTLCVGDAKQQLREQAIEADSVFLDGFSPQRNPDIWDLHTLKAVSRCCRRGTRLATWTVARDVIDGLKACGFEVEKTPGVPPKRDNLQARFNPSWEPKRSAQPADVAGPTEVGSCVVIGAGLAGAACAASLARRGWNVLVLDAHDGPAQGASGLPAGMLAPHVSPDDSVLSRLTRSGVRATFQQAEALLTKTQDWQATGVLQRRFDNAGALPGNWPAVGEHWSAAAPGQLPASTAPHSGAQDLPALWHGTAGWIRPGQLVRALLSQPGISVLYGAKASRLVRAGASSVHWQVHNAKGEVLAEAGLMVIAAGHASAALVESASRMDGLAATLPLQPVHGQVSWGPLSAIAPAGPATQTPSAKSAQEFSRSAASPGVTEIRASSAHPEFPAFPVNGHGSFIPAFQTEQGPCWLAGATYERDRADHRVEDADQLANLERLRVLLPDAAAALEATFASGQARAWAGVRCVSPDRLPLVGPVAPRALPGLWTCTALGSRGLTFAVLCGELVAAQIHGEPLPIENRLLRSLRATRYTPAVRQ